LKKTSTKNHYSKWPHFNIVQSSSFISWIEWYMHNKYAFLCVIFFVRVNNNFRWVLYHNKIHPHLRGNKNGYWDDIKFGCNLYIHCSELEQLSMMTSHSKNKSSTLPSTKLPRSDDVEFLYCFVLLFLLPSSYKCNQCY
jgi:hypothetical protein